MPRGRLVLHTKYIDELGAIVEMKAYQVPKTMSTPHGYKYSLVYIYDGHRLVGYDNHERKGDHCHHRTLTIPYAFKSVDRHIDDFLFDVAAIKKEIAR
jgi:hypothetical protein